MKRILISLLLCPLTIMAMESTGPMRAMENEEIRALQDNQFFKVSLTEDDETIIDNAIIPAGVITNLSYYRLLFVLINQSEFHYHVQRNYYLPGSSRKACDVESGMEEIPSNDPSNRTFHFFYPNNVIEKNFNFFGGLPWDFPAKLTIEHCENLNSK